MKTTILDEYLKDEEFRRLFAQEDLIMEVAETLCRLLEEENVSRKELAARLGKTKGFVSQLLNGGRNLTLRTVADILHVLGYRVSLIPQKEGKNKIFEFPIQSQTLYQVPKGPEYNHAGELNYYSQADNYHNIKKAISG
ncbi:MAG: XRE family transcriptional regulator [Deltaproteobacteria bacterium]|nr:MAG: XRE family transcriptional regulator [Deltaproteobacteria bacterium]